MSHGPIFTLPPVFVHEHALALPLAGEVNWGVETFQVDKLRAYSRGKGVKVGIVDTGVDPTHPLLGNVKAAKDFTGSRYGFEDKHGHGTHVTGTVGATDPRIGMAPEAELYHGKGLGDSGSGGNSLIEAIVWCAEQGCEIISGSFGGGSPSAAWEAEFKRLANAGIWLIIAAGNSGAGTPQLDWPGRSPNVAGIAALNSDKSPASFTSAGSGIATSYAGVDIWSCKPGGGFTRMSGTSMATPGVAGIAADFRGGLKDRGMPIPNIWDLKAMLQSDSTDTHTPGVDLRTGPGFISPVLLAMALSPDPNPVRP